MPMFWNIRARSGEVKSMGCVSVGIKALSASSSGASISRAPTSGQERAVRSMLQLSPPSRLRAKTVRLGCSVSMA